MPGLEDNKGKPRSIQVDTLKSSEGKGPEAGEKKLIVSPENVAKAGDKMAADSQVAASGVAEIGAIAIADAAKAGVAVNTSEASQLDSTAADAVAYRETLLTKVSDAKAELARAQKALKEVGPFAGFSGTKKVDRAVARVDLDEAQEGLERAQMELDKMTNDKPGVEAQSELVSKAEANLSAKKQALKKFGVMSGFSGTKKVDRAMARADVMEAEEALARAKGETVTSELLPAEPTVANAAVQTENEAPAGTVVEAAPKTAASASVEAAAQQPPANEKPKAEVVEVAPVVPPATVEAAPEAPVQPSVDVVSDEEGASLDSIDDLDVVSDESAEGAASEQVEGPELEAEKDGETTADLVAKAFDADNQILRLGGKEISMAVPMAGECKISDVTPDGQGGYTIGFTWEGSERSFDITVGADGKAGAFDATHGDGRKSNGQVKTSEGVSMQQKIAQGVDRYITTAWKKQPAVGDES